MRAVWSYWSKPIRSGAWSPWADQRSHLLSWVLSVETARRHYPECALVTDREGARLLCDELGLTFTDVSTELDALDDLDSSWWAMGKLHAYRAQRQPFVHIDADAYLWKRLPPSLEQAPVFAQSPESADAPYYEPVRMRDVIRARGGIVPPEWSWYLDNGPMLAACCGILGGNDIELLQRYSGMGIDLVMAPHNRVLWSYESTCAQHNMLIEQYLLCACVAYWNAHRPPGTPRTVVQYLFADGNCFRAEEVGYTHLIGGAKQSRPILDKVDEVVRRDYPALHRRAETAAKS